MFLDTAKKLARKEAKRTNMIQYVIHDPTDPENDWLGSAECYSYCDEIDLDTFYHGLDPVWSTDE